MNFIEILNPIIEIIIITIFYNYILSFFWNTRSMDLILGVIAFLFIFALTSVLPFPVLHQLMLMVANVAVIALIIIFQPEIRVTLSKLSLKGRRAKHITEFDNFLEQLATTTYKLADSSTGALIIIEKDDSLEEFARKSVVLNAKFSSELLESIFSKTTPLHDGALIIRNQTITAASVILPLAETPQIQKSLGTRHRAAIGLSLVTDALVIVVSEETGKVSIAREGIITRGIKYDRFKSIIRSLFYKEPNKSNEKKPKNILTWFKK
jgi:diadenylate cyclase